jgi:dTDP-6-deoxy-L-talose 4-dehydrogenase (NAD+)
MKVLVTGVSGFIGSLVVENLIIRGHEVFAFSRSIKSLQKFNWVNKIKVFECDFLGKNFEPPNFVEDCQVCIHLAWPGLSNYQAMSHLESAMLDNYFFIRKLLNKGLSSFLISGTCYEYGLTEGAIREDAITVPVTSYGLAKDTLHKFLLTLKEEQKFILKWARLFYVSGYHPDKKNIFSIIEDAKKRSIDGRVSVDLSGGDQVRDYLPVAEVARRICILAERNDIDGNINICSGEPVAIKNIIVKYLGGEHKNLELNFGKVPYSKFEPMRFWGLSKYFDKNGKLMT